jgi:hypothetical protein
MLQAGSPCRNTGMGGYDMGAKFYQDIPESPTLINIEPLTSQQSVVLEWLMPTTTVHGGMLDTISAVCLWRNSEMIAEINLNSGRNPVFKNKMRYTDNIANPDYYRYRLCVKDMQGNPGRITYSPEKWYGGQMSGVLIWDLDLTPISGPVLKTVIEELEYPGPVYLAANANRYPVESTIDAIFVCLGVYPNNHILTEPEALKLKSFLDSGGNVYMEGGDTWYYDNQTVVHPYFEINPVGDGGADLLYVHGQAGTAYQNFLFQYAGENSFIDQIEGTQNSQKIFYNPSDNFGVAVAHTGNEYKTIGTSFEFGGLVDDATSTKYDLLNQIFEYFGIMPTSISSGNDLGLMPGTFQVKPNYPNPFNNSTRIVFGLPSAGDVKVSIYTVNGQKVSQSESGQLSSGWHEYTWDGRNDNAIPVSSGIYFYQVIYRTQKGEKWVKQGKMHLSK